MNRYVLMFATAIACQLTNVGATAAQANQCDVTLFKSVLKNNSNYKYDYRYANLMSKEVYDDLSVDSTSFSVIQGIPSKSTFNLYNSYAQKVVTSTRQSLNIDQARNALWVGLDDIGLKAYQTCLAKTQDRGLHLILGKATESVVEVLIYYDRLGKSEAKLRWNSTAEELKVDPLPQKQAPSDLIDARSVTFKRPNAGTEALVKVDNFGGTGSATIILTSYQKPLPAPTPPCIAANAAGECLACLSKVTISNFLVQNNQPSPFEMVCDNMAQVPNRAYRGVASGYIKYLRGNGNFEMNASLSDGSEKVPSNIAYIVNLNDYPNGKDFSLAATLKSTTSQTLTLAINIQLCGTNGICETINDDDGKASRAMVCSPLFACEP